MIVYPAIDIIDGQCVRLTHGKYDSKKVYSNDPAEVARGFEDAGFTHLHMVDLDGAKAGKVANLSILERTANATSLHIDFGGGIRSHQDVDDVLNAGAKQINVGSLAVKKPEIVKSWIEQYGSSSLILSADVKDGNIALHGWQDQSQILLIDFVMDYSQAGIEYITCTDISKDGALSGASTQLYKELVDTFPELKIIASGGVHTLHNLTELKLVGCHGAIVGKAIYEKQIDLMDLVKVNQ